MDIDAERRGVLRTEPLGHEARDDPRQYVARAGRRHTRVARRVEIHPSGRTHDSRVVALQHNDDVIVLRHLDRLLQTLLGSAVTSEESVELARVGRDDRVERKQRQKRRTLRDAVQRVGVEDER